VAQAVTAIDLLVDYVELSNSNQDRDLRWIRKSRKASRKGRKSSESWARIGTGVLSPREDPKTNATFTKDLISWQNI
jgi:hypothetical protein